MFSPHRGSLLVALVAGSLLCACGDSPSGDAAPVGSSNKPAATAKSGDVPPDMVAAVSAGDASAHIGVHFKLGAPPVVNRALPVDIVIVPQREYSIIRGHFEGQNGLTVTAGNGLEPVSPAAPGKVIKHQLVLLPAREGVFMLTVGLDTEGKEGNVVRIFSIPVIVAAEAPATPEPPRPAAPAAN